MMTMNRKYAPATTIVTTLALLMSMCAGLTFSQRALANSESSVNKTEYPLLTKYATDLTKLAAAGKLEVTRDHEADVARVIASLVAARNPVVISESDLDRDVIARAIAIKIAFGDVPEALRDKRVFRLSIDALAKGAKSSDEFSMRVQSVLAEAAQAEGRVLLFVDQLNQYAGSRATVMASAAVKDAIEANHLRIVGGASPQAYASYIASDESVAKLFESISIDHVDGLANVKADKRRSPIDEEFEGEKISSDMRDLMKSARNGRVTAILQVSDVNNKEVRALLAQNGVLLSDWAR
jgi:ATP-dependent Clp protease ATP-binding subunit ClpB